MAQNNRVSVAVSLSEFLDRQTGKIFILPAVVTILAFAIFPLLSSAYLSLSKFKLADGGFQLSFVGLRNFKKLFLGSQQYHLLGTFDSFGLLEIIIFGLTLALTGYWFWRFLASGQATVIGLVGRLIAAATLLALIGLALATIFGGYPGSIIVTIIYVLIGVCVQFGIGLVLALLCSHVVFGRNFFRIVFFIPLMVTPVGIAYIFRMLADLQRGPLATVWQWFGLSEFSWAANAWTARLVVLVGDTWQWVPFMFIVLLAAIESVPRDQQEAARIDGAGNWHLFRDITWPSIAPVAATIVLIRLIEAFKIVDLPNILTNGGPGIATESLTLHSFIAWRTQELGASAAVGYTLLFLATISCLSFFNFIGRKSRQA